MSEFYCYKVTVHAYHRWRQRVNAGHGDHEILAAVRASRPATEGERGMLLDGKGLEMRVWAERYVLLLAREAGARVLVTVYGLGELNERSRKREKAKGSPCKGEGE